MGQQYRRGYKDVVETEIKYAGYIRKQERAVERFRKLEAKRLPEWLNYEEIEDFPGRPRRS